MISLLQLHPGKLLRKMLGSLVIAIATGSLGFAADIHTIKLPPAPNMDRAELHYINTVANPKAVLVLCPGFNGSGERLIQAKAWQEFAQSERLGLVGLSFASPVNTFHDGTGYYYASKGSGQVLLDGIREIYGNDLPLILYGFSGGAHFASRFTEWKPERVLTWCAYSAGWWDEPKLSETTPPGIVACGDADHRLGASLIYFKQGRAVGKPWLWVSLGGIGHVGSRPLDEFVRNYFSVILGSRSTNGVWVDVDTKKVVPSKEAAAQPVLSGWLPSEKLLDEWRTVHTP